MFTHSHWPTRARPHLPSGSRSTRQFSARQGHHFAKSTQLSLTLCLQFFLCVAASKTLKSFRTQYWDLLPAASSATAACQATQTASDVAATKVALLQAKKLQPRHIPPAALSALTFCIASRVQLRALCSRLHQLQKAPVSTQDAHCSLRLQVLRQIGTWSEWGFQGKDPCTDFRGSGQLGLECLYAMQQSIPDTVLRLLNESRDDQTAYPLACAVINVTHRCSAALHLGSLDAAMHAGDYQDVAFHRVVACATCRSVLFWRLICEVLSSARVPVRCDSHRLLRDPLQAALPLEGQQCSLLCATCKL